MTITAVRHVDERAVVRLQRIARVEVRDAVGADHLPVGAAAQHPPREPLAAEAAAGDGNDAPTAERRLAQLHRRRELDLRCEQAL
jgi:hypothetical protein